MALVAVLAVYLLPFLVGRRETMRMANADDRFSAGLRLLPTGSVAVSGEDCGGGHAMIFRRRPEVTVMNRPEVRNVRALRKERELARLRQAHERGRERRRVAASHRAAVALILLGVTLGTLAVAAVTALPLWAGAFPGALLGASAVAGRRAALASAESERRERRRIAAVERELMALTGGSTVNRMVERTTTQDSGDSGPLNEVKAAEPDEEAEESLTRRAVMDALKEAGKAHATTTQPVAQESAVQGETAHEDAVASPSAAVDDATDVAGAQAPSREAEALPATPTELTGSAAAAEPQDRSRDSQEDVKAPATPPQGWHPVSVPAPTYTLAARAPRRNYEPPAEEPFDSAPVPERPRSAHAFPTAGVEVEVDEPVFHPIDLEAVLERRRAGA